MKISKLAVEAGPAGGRPLLAAKMAPNKQNLSTTLSHKKLSKLTKNIGFKCSRWVLELFINVMEMTKCQTLLKISHKMLKN